MDCGTGRAINYFSRLLPNLEILAIESVSVMLYAAVITGIPPEVVLPGSASALLVLDDSFDSRTAFGIPHLVPQSQQAIRELFRLSRRTVFISDHNVYGMGSPLTRGLKQLFRDLHARWLLRLLLTGGKGYHDTDWDAVFISLFAGGSSRSDSLAGHEGPSLSHPQSQPQHLPAHLPPRCAGSALNRCAS